MPNFRLNDCRIQRLMQGEYVLGGAMRLHDLQQQHHPASVPNGATRLPYHPAATQLSTVIANLGYLPPTEARPYEYAYEPPNGMPWQNCGYDTRAMRITDARSFASSPSVHK